MLLSTFDKKYPGSKQCFSQTSASFDLASILHDYLGYSYGESSITRHDFLGLTTVQTVQGLVNNYGGLLGQWIFDVVNRLW